MLSRRDALKAAAAVPAATVASSTDALAAPAQEVADPEPKGRLIACAPDPTVPITITLPDHIDFQIGLLDELLIRLAEDVSAEYEADLERVIALDPELLHNRVGHPVCDLDETVRAVLGHAQLNGLRLGAALGLGLIPHSLVPEACAPGAHDRNETRVQLFRASGLCDRRPVRFW